MSVKAPATPPLPCQAPIPLVPPPTSPTSLIVIGWRITGKSRTRVAARFSTAIALFMLMSKRIYQIRIQRQIQIRVPATVLTRFINFQRLMRLTQFSATEMMTTPPPSPRTIYGQPSWVPKELCKLHHVIYFSLCHLKFWIFSRWHIPFANQFPI